MKARAIVLSSFPIAIDTAHNLLVKLMSPSDVASLGSWLDTHPLQVEDLKWFTGERLAPYIYDRIRRLGLTSHIAPEALSVLYLEYLSCASQNLLLTNEMQGLLTDLRGAGVEPIILKGMALGILVYPLLATRPMGDLDLLIKKSEVETVKQVFAARGYSDMGLEPELHAGFPSHLHAWRAYPGGRRVVIEAHWHLFHESAYRQLDLESWWERTCTVSFEGSEVRVLDPIDALIYACAHLLLHHSSDWNLLWLLDLRLLIDRYGATWNWKVVADRAQFVQMSGLVEHVLGLCQRWFGPCVPTAGMELLGVRPGNEELHYLKMSKNLNPLVLQLNLKRARGLGFWRRLQAYLEILFPPWTYMQYRYGAGSRWTAPRFYFNRLVRAVQVAFKRVG